MHGYSLLMEEDGGIRATKLCAWLTVFFFSDVNVNTDLL
jgi:hypothetical protein